MFGGRSEPVASRFERGVGVLVRWVRMLLYWVVALLDRSEPVAPRSMQVAWLLLYSAVAFVIVRVLIVRSCLGQDLLSIALALVVEGVVPGIISEWMREVLSDETAHDVAGDVMEVSSHLSLTAAATLMTLSQAALVAIAGGPGIWGFRWTRTLWILLAIGCALSIGGMFCKTKWFVNYQNHRDCCYITWIYPNMVQAPMSYFRVILGLVLFSALVSGSGVL